MVDRRDLMVNNIWICPIAIDALSEARLIVDGGAGRLGRRRAAPLEGARLNLKRVIAAIAILIDPPTDRVVGKSRLNLCGPVAPISEDPA
jgi:hypothetical protein